MVKLLIVTCVYPPEPTISAQTSAQVATAMANRGHAVTVVAPFPSHPAGRVYPPFHRRAFQVTQEPNGIRIIRIFATISSQSTILSRSLENLTFGLGAAVVAAVLDRPDVIYANTWPIMAQALIRLVGRLRGVPIVLSIQDMYPESLISQNRVTGDTLLVRGMRALDGWIARGAADVIVISEIFARRYKETRGVPSERLHCVPNWIMEDSLTLSDGTSPIRTKHGIRAEEKLFVYGGNIGAAAGVETVIAALQCTPDTSPCRLLIAGEGSELRKCRDLARRSSDRIHFVSPWPLAETSDVLASADVLVLPTRNRQSLSSVPSKLLTYMLAGKPILAAVLRESDTARVIAEAGCGWVVEPDDPCLLGRLMEHVALLNARELQERGRRGREYVLENFGQKQAIGRLISLLESHARQSAVAPAGSEGPSSAGIENTLAISLAGKATAGTPCLSVGPVRPGDVSKLVDVHLRSFPGFFLAFLGPRFLRLLYAEILNEPGHVALAAGSPSGEMLGFAVGVTDQSGFYARLARRRWFSFAVASLPAVLRRPLIAPRLLRALRAGDDAQVGMAEALLISIAVLPEYQSRGLGRELLTQFLLTLEARGVKSVSLKTDADNNEHANRFYSRLGFNLARVYWTPEHRRMNEYVIDLPTGCSRTVDQLAAVATIRPHEAELLAGTVHT